MNEKSEGKSFTKDPMRYCYVCRMPISVLAIRCRYCGAEVGRPRKEQETYTIEDLGGERVGTYTVSGNVTDSLESFIMEERAQAEAEERERLEMERKSLRGRMRRIVGKDSGIQHKDGSDLEFSIDPRNVNSISLSGGSHSSTMQRRKTPSGDIGMKLIGVAALIIGVIVLYFATDFAWSWLRGHGARQTTDEEFIYPNRAREILARGALLEAHEEALIALRHNNTPENTQIAREIRGRLIESVKERAYATPFDMAKLSGASRDITLAGQRDSDREISQLMETVNREVGYFAFILTHLDAENEKATFRLNNPALLEREQEVQPGDLLQGRFQVISVTARGVVLEDTNPQSRGRQLISKRMLPVEAY